MQGMCTATVGANVDPTTFAVTIGLVVVPTEANLLAVLGVAELVSALRASLLAPTFALAPSGVVLAGTLVAGVGVHPPTLATTSASTLSWPVELRVWWWRSGGAGRPERERGKEVSLPVGSVLTH